MIKITKGNVLENYIKNTVIVHCCNDINSFGSGVAGNIKRKYPQVATDYHSLFELSDRDLSKLGQIQFSNAEKGVVICNLIGQRDIGGFTIDKVFVPPIRYEAIYEGMLRLREKLKASNYKDIDLRSPLLGCGLAGGKLESIYHIVAKVFGAEPITYTFYAFTDDDYKFLEKVHNEY